MKQLMNLFLCVQKKDCSCVLLFVRQCLNIVSCLSVTFYFSFLETGKQKYFNTADLKLAGASATSQTLSPGSPSPLPPPVTFAQLLDLYKRVKRKG